MKIVICAKHDLAGNLALNRLVQALAPRHELHVVLSDHVLKVERERHFASYLLRYERDILLNHVFPALDREFPAGSTAACLTAAGLAATYHIPVELWGCPRTSQAIHDMRRLSPDIILSCRYDYIFPEEILCMPRFGAYGMHPGTLPQIQGLCAPFRAMQRGHKRSGCTLFHIDKGIDSGAIVDIGWMDIDYSKSLLWNFVHTYFSGIEIFFRYLPMLANEKRLPGKFQDDTKRHYYGYPSEKEFREFIDSGGALVSNKDFLELLSRYLPGGLSDPRLSALEDLLRPLAS